MNVKRAWLSTLVVALLCTSAIRSQDNFGSAPLHDYPVGMSPSTTPAAATVTYDPNTPGNAPPAPGLSNWILHTCPTCGWPLNGNEVSSELYLRSGISFPIGAKTLTDVLDDGWDLQAGARVSFFNQAADAAWVVDLGLENVNNAASSPRTFQLNNVFEGLGGSVLVPQVDVQIQRLNRTSFNYGFGRDWYLWGHANDTMEPNFRYGVDIGGKWGTAMMTFDNWPHRTEEFLGTYLDIHADYVYPWRCYEFFAGLRLEWDYTWMNHILQANNTQLTELNLLIETGLRF